MWQTAIYDYIKGSHERQSADIVCGAKKTVLEDGKNITAAGNGTKDGPYKENVNDDLNLSEKGTNGKDGSIGVNTTNEASGTMNG